MNRGDQPYAEVIRIGGAAIFSDEIHGVLYAIALRRAHFNLYLSDVDVSWEGFRMPTIRPIARLDWSGVEKLDLEFPKPELDRLIELIPITTMLDQTETQSRNERIASNLIEIRARFQRYLHQDEFGPRRPDQAEGLRFLQTQFERLARDAGHEALDQIADILDSFDAGAHSELFDDAWDVGLDVTALRDEVAPQQRAKKLALLTNTVRKTIDRLSRARGPNPGKSIRALISQLATLWEEVTGLEPTASSEETYRTAFESFALASAVAFLPTELWFEERKYLLKPGEKNKFISGKIDSAVLQAIREMRATGSSRRGRPPRG